MVLFNKIPNYSTNIASKELNIDNYHKNHNNIEHKSVFKKVLATETDFQGLTKTTRE